MSNETIEVTVNVKNENDDVVDGVEVVFSQNDIVIDNQTSDNEGTCTFEVENGVYFVTATADEYLTYESNFNVTSENNVLDIILVNPIVPVVRSDNNLFQARVFLENQGNVYGAEVVIFGQNSPEPIEKILITDVTDFDYLTSVVENLKEAFVPYTSEDKSIFEVICEYLADPDDIEKEAKYLAVKDKWSSLHNKGNLRDILFNNLVISEEDRKSYEDSELTIINATHINGVNAGDLSKIGHVHPEYLNQTHSSVQGTNDSKGHVKVIDNLNSEDTVGSALSANQGRILNDRVKVVEKAVNDNPFSKSFKLDKNGYMTLRVNPALHLCICSYNRSDYTGLKKDTGIHTLHAEGTLGQYKPVSRVLTPVYRGDIVLMFNTDGSVKIHNLTKHDTWNIHAQVMWYYK